MVFCRTSELHQAGEKFKICSCLTQSLIHNTYTDDSVSFYLQLQLILFYPRAVITRLS